MSAGTPAPAPAGDDSVPGSVSPTLKVVVVLLGLAVVAGLVVLAVAGLTGALAGLLTVAALLVMVVLGNQIGGRNTPARPPLAVDDDGSADRPGPPADAVGGGTMEG